MKKTIKANRKKATLPESIKLKVCSYTLNVHACLVDLPLYHPVIQDAKALIEIYGKSEPQGWAFWIYVYPDGSTLIPAFLRETCRRVEMSVHQSQLAAIMAVLSDSNESEAGYDATHQGPATSVVTGTFSRPPMPKKCAPSKPMNKRGKK